MDAGAIMSYVRAGANPNTPNSQGVTALMLLAQTGEADAVRDLLLDGADVNWQENDGWTALMFAVHDERLETFQLLLAASGVNLTLQNKHGQTCLDIAKALGGGKSVFVQKLEAAGAGGVGGIKPESRDKPNSIFKFFGF